MSANDSNPQRFKIEGLDVNRPIQAPPPGYDGRDLEEMLPKIELAVEQGDEQQITKAELTFKMLATAVGQSKAWQTPLRTSGVLTHASRNVSSPRLSPELRKQYLRVIGNCVADNDENREVVMRDLDHLIVCMQKDELATTALAVIFNLCNDFEPAQVEAVSLRLDRIIISRLVTNQIPEEALDYAAELVGWTTEKLSNDQIRDTSSIGTFDNILDITRQCDEDHYHDYVAACAYYLQDAEFQKNIGTTDRMIKLLSLTRDYESRLEPKEQRAVLQALATQHDPQAEPSEDHTVLVLVQLINSVSALSASDTFVQNFDIQSPIGKSLTTHLFNTSITPSTVCDCIIVGNIATSDKTSIYIVEVLHFNNRLEEILLSQQEPALLYAAAACMRHLAFPENNRVALSGVIVACSRLLSRSDDSSVRGETAALLGKLVSNNLQNIKSVVFGTIADGILSPPQSIVELPERPTHLQNIVVQALAPAAPLPSTSMKNAMIELGRTIVTTLRYLAKGTSEEGADTVLDQMYKTSMIARPIARLVRQRFYADARAEGLLGLGLMAQSRNGAACVVEELKADDGLLKAIKEMVTEQKQEGQASSATLGRDHQNALVLLHGLRANGGEAMDSSLREEVESLRGELSRLSA